MQGASWINLFGRIPANLHDGLALALTTGNEVVVQCLIKLDPDYVILRGRLAGTQDSGRVVILPYSQLVSIAFNRHLTEPEVEAIFGQNAQPLAADPKLSPNGAAAAPPGEATDERKEKAPPVNGKSAAATPAKPVLPSKAELLAKLRSRLGDTNRPNG
jgi:hypothetical protein